jgi:hypothetical protein
MATKNKDVIFDEFCVAAENDFSYRMIDFLW